MMERLLGLVLAGGQSRRMGAQDKTLLQLGDLPLIAHAIRRLDTQIDTLAINTNAAREPFEAFGYPVLQDSISGYQGPLAGVLTGLDHAREQGFSHLVSVAADTPFFPADLVMKLRAGLPAQIVLAESNGRSHPTFGLWSVEVALRLRNFLEAGDDRRIMRFVEQCHATSVAFELGQDGQDPFFNINKPSDLAQAEIFLEAGFGG